MTTHSLIEPTESVSHPYQEEADKIVTLIRQAQTETPQATIAILVRNHNHVSHIAPSLKTAGIRYRAVDIEPLQDHPVIQDLMSLTHAS